MDRGAWQAAVHGVAKSWTRLSDFTFTFHFHALEKEMATHSSVLAWKTWWAAVYGVAQSRTRLKRLSSSSSSTRLNPLYDQLVLIPKMTLYGRYYYLFSFYRWRNLELARLIRPWSQCAGCLNPHAYCNLLHSMPDTCVSGPR